MLLDNRNTRSLSVSSCVFRSIYVIGLGTGVLLSISKISYAQLKSVDQKQYKIEGAKIGAFSVITELDSGLYFDSNIFESTDAVTEDVVKYIIPRVLVTSHLPNHSLNLDAGLKHLDYRDNDQDSITEWDAVLYGTLDIRKDLELDFRIKGARETQKRTFDDALVPSNLAEPLKKNYFETGLSLKKTFNRLLVALGLGYEKSDVRDGIDLTGNSIEQDFNDNEAVKISSNFEYTVSSKLKLFFNVGQTFTDFKNVATTATTTGGLDLTGRDFDELEFTQGFKYIYSPKTEAEFRFHVYKEDYKNEDIPDLGFLHGYEYILNWTPNTIWATSFSALWKETGVDFSEDAGGGELTRFGSTITYNPRKYLTIQSKLAYEFREFDDREEQEIFYHLSGSYAAAKNFLLSVNYDFNKEISDIADDRNRHLIQGSVKHQF